VNADDIAASINAGDLDDDLDVLFKSLFARAVDIDTEFSWKISVGGDEWNRETITLAELAFAERLVKVPYIKLDPIGSMDHLVALIIAHYHQVKGLKASDAIAAAGKLTAGDLDDIISVYEVKQAPKDGMEIPAAS
jgi:hypothetical protein